MVNPLQLLKENAPSVYAQVCASKTAKLNARITNLRIEYKMTKDPVEKEKIKQEADSLKKQLEDYKQ